MLTSCSSSVTPKRLVRMKRKLAGSSISGVHYAMHVYGGLECVLFSADVPSFIKLCLRGNLFRLWRFADRLSFDCGPPVTTWAESHAFGATLAPQ